jgi:hypothetical protein
MRKEFIIALMLMVSGCAKHIEEKDFSPIQFEEFPCSEENYIGLGGELVCE